MSELLTASEANQLSLKHILDKIKQDADRGDTYLFISLSEPTVEKLKEMGYVVEYKIGVNKYKISW